MPRLQDLQEKRSAKVTEMRAINERALNDNRDFNDGEREQYEALDKEVRSLSEQVERAERLAAYERLEERSEPTGGSELRRELRSYNVGKAVIEGFNGRLTGLEAEVHADLSRGREVRGVMIPTDVLLETRAVLTTGTGGNMVQNDLASMTDRRRPALRVESLGATVVRGLTGNLDLPRLASSGSTHWIAEHADTTRSDATFSKKSMTPRTVSAEYEVSRRMMLQSHESIDGILRRDLGQILAASLDAAAIAGDGVVAPLGIMNDPDVEELTAAALSSDVTADMIAALETDDVTGTRAFLTNPAVIALARKIKETDSGRAIPIAETFHSERVVSSTQVPEVSSGSVGALIYGEWSSLYLGYWSGVDILMNPYHADVASKGGALLHAFLDCDVVVRHPEGFRWMEING